MHLFTSNSSERISDIPWAKTWLMSGAIVIGTIILWNMFWISHRVYPLPKDTPALWSYYREKAENADRNIIVFIGSSRTQIAINQQTVKEVVGKTPVQLAIAGESPFLVLKNLAEDDSFRGIVV